MNEFEDFENQLIKFQCLLDLAVAYLAVVLYHLRFFLCQALGSPSQADNIKESSLLQINHYEFHTRFSWSESEYSNSLRLEGEIG